MGLCAVLSTGLLSSACSTQHWAQVETQPLPPPPGPKVLHTSRLVVQVTEATEETQCVAQEDHSPVCYYNLRPSLEAALLRSLWPSFPEVVLGRALDARGDDYFLQVEINLDALPPDAAGPGWSAGAQSRYRLIRAGKVLSEETLASRSRAEFPYGAPLGAGASEVVEATVLHIATRVSQVEESQPWHPVPLPAVASRKITDSNSPARSPSDTTNEPRQPRSESSTPDLAKTTRD